LSPGALPVRKQSCRWSGALALQVEQVSIRRACTQFSTLLTAFAALLHSITRQTDLLMAQYASTRMSEIESVIGMFITLLLVRVNVSGDPTFADLLARVSNALLEAHDDRDLPLIQALPSGVDTVVTLNQGAPRDRSGSPPIGELTLEPVPVSIPDGMRNDLEWCADFTEQGITITLFYSELLEEVTIERLLRQYRALLERCLSAPDTPLTSLLRGLA
jgi:non-ribosomal peptide synthetase component F